MLQIRDVRYSYPFCRREILKGVSLEVADGEILCLLGSNGVGKTTLLRCLLGFERPKSGSIEVDGTDVTRLSEHSRARYMAYVPQYSSLAFPYTACEVVLMGRVSHMSHGAGFGAEDQQAADEALERLRVSHLSERRFQEMSGGERQMVLVARALAQRSRLLVMDEPTANLDYHNQVRILAAIKSLSEEGLSIFMTSHYPDHAFLACSRAALMSGGTIVSAGLPDEVVTSESLTELYGTPVCVAAADAGGVSVKTCIPMLDADAQSVA